MDIKPWTALASCAALALSISACGTVAPPTQRPAAALQTPEAPGEATFVARWPVLEGFAVDTVRDRAYKLKLRLNVEKELRARCALPEPRFGFDSDDLGSDDEAELSRVSRCFTHGPLRDRTIALIGRADRRGDPYYNMALGQRRADQVKSLLVKQGVPASRIVTTTRGATASRGQLAGYSDDDDRRVDILIRD